jgi:hypothetical protein
LLNPDLYSDQDSPISGDENFRARERIKQYRSSFAGWSMYTVAGVFFGEAVKSLPERRPTQHLEPIEELVQVLRLIFRFSRRDLDKASDPLLAAALEAECDDVYRIIVFRTISRSERAVGLHPLGAERARALSRRASSLERATLTA